MTSKKWRRVNVRELNLHERFLDDAFEEIMDAIEECAARGESEICLIHGHVQGDVIKRWICSPQLEAALQKINVKVVNRSLIPKNNRATHLKFSGMD